MDTSHVEYGRCADCGEIKQITDDGLLQAHNRYDANGTAVTVSRCPGSGRRLRDEPRESVA